MCYVAIQRGPPSPAVIYPRVAAVQYTVELPLFIDGSAHSPGKAPSWAKGIAFFSFFSLFDPILSPAPVNLTAPNSRKTVY
jgi:hypothetical protein